jgi:hypothetical protein
MIDKTRRKPGEWCERPDGADANLLAISLQAAHDGIGDDARR